MSFKDSKIIPIGKVCPGVDETQLYDATIRTLTLIKFVFIAMHV